MVVDRPQRSWVCTECPPQWAGTVVGVRLESVSLWNQVALFLRLEEPQGPQRRAVMEVVNSGETFRASMTLCPRHREGTVGNMALRKLWGQSKVVQVQLEGPRDLLIHLFREFRFYPKGGGKLGCFYSQEQHGQILCIFILNISIASVSQGLYYHG